MYVVSGFSRTTTVRLKADVTYKRKMLSRGAYATIASALGSSASASTSSTDFTG